MRTELPVVNLSVEYHNVLGCIMHRRVTLLQFIFPQLLLVALDTQWQIRWQTKVPHQDSIDTRAVTSGRMANDSNIYHVPVYGKAIEKSA